MENNLVKQTDDKSQRKDWICYWNERRAFAKRHIYGEFNCGKRPRHKPRKSYKECVKENLKKLDMKKNDVLDRNK
ncbi:Hypothetical predicted protein [Octopus vulgaris]|uniref:Uncharacterized protein n=1 Tax=Octopus vulgaris TaxID=6645 RepID=A0AA36AVS9_OCTVU|nr:Hypothetical predicted protein [Octopus vulgaris]